MSRQWLSVDLLTGSVLAYLPDIECTQPLRRTLGAYDTAQATLHITKKTDPNWERAILQGAAALISYSGDEGNEIVEWGGIVMQSPRDLTAAVQLSLATPEAYLDRCYVGDYDVTGRDQNLIVTDLIEQFAADTGRIPIATAVVGDPGTVRDRTYVDSSNTTVYGALQELMGVAGGPEWCMTWQWTHNPDVIVPVLQVGSRIGRGVTEGLAPGVTFEVPMIQSGAVAHDYSSGVGANLVTAYSNSSKGGSASSVADDLKGRPLWEYRYTPSTSIKDPDVLKAHADAAVGAMNDGSNAITAVVPRGTIGMQLGVDWDLGDDVGFTLQSVSIPNGYAGIARCVAYETTPTTVTPILNGAQGADQGGGGGGGGEGGYTIPAGSTIPTLTDGEAFREAAGVNTHANFSSYES